MKRVFLILLNLAVLCMLPVGASFGYEINTQGIISKYPVYVYVKPSETSDVIGVPHKGDKLWILKKEEGVRKEPGRIVSDFWYMVKFKEQKGWVFSKDICQIEDDEKTLLAKFQMPMFDRAEVIRNLGLIKSAKAKTMFLELFKERGSMELAKYKPNLIEALGTYRDPEIIPLFVEALNDRTWAARWYAIEALGNYQDTSLAEYLIPLLYSKDRRLKAAAVKVLLSLNSEGIKRFVAQEQHDLTQLFDDLQQAYNKQQIESLAKYLDFSRGFYLEMHHLEGVSQPQWKLSAAEAQDFFNGRLPSVRKESRFLSIRNVRGFRLTSVYTYPEEVILKNAGSAIFYSPDLEFIEKNKIKNYEAYLLVTVQWDGYRDFALPDYKGAYWHLLKQKGKWSWVGMELIYR